MIVHLAISILHKQLDLPGGLNGTVQVLSVHPFDTPPVKTLLAEENTGTPDAFDCNQLMLRDL